jgi:hypothetical protein
MLIKKVSSDENHKLQRRRPRHSVYKEKKLLAVQCHLTYLSFALLSLTAISVLVIVFLVGFGLMILDSAVLLLLISGVIIVVAKRDFFITKSHFRKKGDK